jgi:hypothetical protein
MIAPTGIIVLGGASDAEKSEARGQVYLNSDAARMTAGIELVRRYPRGASRLLRRIGGNQRKGSGSRWACLASA